jgi:hypothetical protein
MKHQSNCINQDTTEGDNHHATIQQTSWFYLLRRVERRACPRRHHFVPDLLLFLFLFLLLLTRMPSTLEMLNGKA